MGPSNPNPNPCHPTDHKGIKFFIFESKGIWNLKSHCKLIFERLRIRLVYVFKN